MEILDFEFFVGDIINWVVLGHFGSGVYVFGPNCYRELFDSSFSGN